MGKPLVTLISDGGEMTVGRRVSTFIYGKMAVTLHEGVVQDKPDDDLEQGYIVAADGDTPRGRFDFTFTRHDASMNMELHTSDMEQGIVAASKRVSGDVFFERDIEQSGFGRWVPGRDFDVGDIVNVSVWGKLIELPVTSLNLHNGSWVAHVGGQMIHDAEKLRSQNQSVEKTIADERRRLAKETGAIASVANKAKSDAASAQSSADAAGTAAKNAQSSADAADQKAVAAQSSADQAGQGVQNLQEVLAGKNATAQDVTDQLAILNAQLQARDEPTGPLIPAYIAANTERWKLQDQVNKMQQLEQKRLRELAESTQAATAANTKARLLGEQLAEAKRREDNLRPKMSVAYQQQWLKEPYTTPDGLFRFETDKASLDRGVFITALGDWEGDIVVFMSNITAFGTDGGTEVLLGRIRKDGGRTQFYKPVKLVGVNQVVILVVPQLF
ncbi:hypothetical protein [Corynebacterium jeikeium]|uniref:hypothetical protein n=1 Tax=Corynebacterium jeikeium TaxID=38289 RepID=UPI0008847CBF|nr:hypothetical protein [Corynebacterium jeikeium]SCX06645.1 hypothetical protein CJBVI_0499 [Corynebacterium jeikeium]